MRDLWWRKLGDVNKIKRRLNVKKIEEGVNGKAKYLDMHSWFIFDMRKLNLYGIGFDHTDNEYHFAVSGTDTILFLLIAFDDKTGEFKTIVPVPKRQSKKTKNAVYDIKERNALRTAEINDIIEAFEKKAFELGYLL